MIRTFAATLATTTCLVALATPAAAQTREYNVPAGSLRAALDTFARQSGRQVIYRGDEVKAATSPGVNGARTAEDALDAILTGTGFVARKDRSGAFGVVKAGNAAGVISNGSTSGDSLAQTGLQPHETGGNDILVTGTRIRGTAPVGAPLIVIDRKTIEDSGRATVADYIQSLPQNFGGGSNEGLTGTTSRNNAAGNTAYGSSIDLRGLGTDSTLVLFDGNRPALGGAYGAFTDTSLIPSEAIDRIEILTDGASAIYGTDAVAGVVNIRFRDHFDGYEAHLVSGTADGAFSQQQVSQITGKRWSNGGFVVAYQYDHRGALPGADRRASTEDLTSWGGPDNRSPFATLPNIIAADGSVFAVSSGIPAGRSATSDLIAGQTNLIDNQKRIDLIPEQTTNSVYFAADQSIVPGLSLFAHVLYARRSFRTARLPRDEAITVPTSNPYYVDPTGTDEPITVERDFENLVGTPHQYGVVDAISATGGAEGDVGGWHYVISGSYGRQHETYNIDNEVNYGMVATLLNSSDPAKAFDPFGANSAATINAIRGEENNHSDYNVWSAAVRADGDLFKLPAGWVKLAIGAEHRRESLSVIFSDTVFSDARETYPLNGTPNHRHINSIYAELLVPFFDRPNAFPGNLKLSLAGRSEWYSDVGATQNPKAGLSWKPTKGLTFRGSFGTSFRAPSFVENVGASNNYYIPFTVADPASPTGSRSVIEVGGTAAKLNPEKATTWTVGSDYTPSFAPGLKLSASYFNIDYRDRIGSAGYYDNTYFVYRNVYGSLIQDNPSAATIAALYANPMLYNIYNIPASAITAIIDTTVRNLSVQNVTGVDLDLNYQRSLLGGNFRIGIDGTRFLHFDQQITAQAPKTSVLSTFAYPVKLRFRGNTGWTNGKVSVTGTVNYTAGYSNNILAPAQHVGAWTTVDSEIGYTFPKGTPFGHAHLALDVTNLLNKAPPYVNNTSFSSTIAYDPGAANAIGRVISVQATFGW